MEWKKVCPICGEDINEETAVAHRVMKHPQGSHWMVIVPVLPDVVIPKVKKKVKPKKKEPEDEEEIDAIGDLTI